MPTYGSEEYWFVNWQRIRQNEKEIESEWPSENREIAVSYVLFKDHKKQKWELTLTQCNVILSACCHVSTLHLSIYFLSNFNNWLVVLLWMCICPKQNGGWEQTLNLTQSTPFAYMLHCRLVYKVLNYFAQCVFNMLKSFVAPRPLISVPLTLVFIL